MAMTPFYGYRGSWGKRKENNFYIRAIMCLAFDMCYLTMSQVRGHYYFHFFFSCREGKQDEVTC